MSQRPPTPGGGHKNVGIESQMQEVDASNGRRVRIRCGRRELALWTLSKGNSRTGISNFLTFLGTPMKTFIFTSLKRNFLYRV